MKKNWGNLLAVFCVMVIFAMMLPGFSLAKEEAPAQDPAPAAPAAETPAQDPAPAASAAETPAQDDFHAGTPGEESVVTEAPVQDDGEEVPAQDDGEEAPAAEAPSDEKAPEEVSSAEQAAVKKTVVIERVTEGEIRVGDRVTFKAKVEGFVNPQYQWQLSSDHETWEDLEGETGVECELEITGTRCYIRVAVTEA